MQAAIPLQPMGSGQAFRARPRINQSGRKSTCHGPHSIATVPVPFFKHQAPDSLQIGSNVILTPGLSDAVMSICLSHFTPLVHIPRSCSLGKLPQRCTMCAQGWQRLHLVHHGLVCHTSGTSCAAHTHEHLPEFDADTAACSNQSRLH